MNTELLESNKKKTHNLILSFQCVQRTFPMDELSDSLSVLFTENVVHVEILL